MTRNIMTVHTNGGTIPSYTIEHPELPVTRVIVLESDLAQSQGEDREFFINSGEFIYTEPSMEDTNRKAFYDEVEKAADDRNNFEDFV